MDRIRIVTNSEVNLIVIVIGQRITFRIVATNKQSTKKPSLTKKAPTLRPITIGQIANRRLIVDQLIVYLRGVVSYILRSQIIVGEYKLILRQLYSRSLQTTKKPLRAKEKPTLRRIVFELAIIRKLFATNQTTNQTNQTAN